MESARVGVFGGESCGRNPKDTVVNIEQTREFVINLVSVGFLEPMELFVKPIPCGEDERAVKGIHLIAAKTVKSSRIQEAKVSFECVLERIIRVDEGANVGNLILGRVQLMHGQDGLVIGAGRLTGVV